MVNFRADGPPLLTVRLKFPLRDLHLQKRQTTGAFFFGLSLGAALPERGKRAISLSGSSRGKDMKNRPARILRFFAAAVLAVAIAGAAHISLAADKTAASAPVGGAFSLVDHAGQPVTEKTWPGKYKLVFFGFTHCPEICPAALSRIAEAMEKDAAAFEKVQVLFVTTDPARDTPQAMKEYVANFNPAILGLTGTEEQVKAAETAYKVYAAKRETDEGKDYTMDHSAFIYLMSPDDKMLTILRAETKPEEIAAKVRELAS